MAENLMCQGHKTSTEKYRERWEQVFGKNKKEFTPSEITEYIKVLHAAEIYRERDPHGN